MAGATRQGLARTCRTLLLLALATFAALAGCGGDGGEGEATTAGEQTTAAAPGTISLADVAGRWDMRAMTESGDSTLLTYEMNATADTSGWSLIFPDRAPVPVRVVAVDADSIMIEAGPYESALRKGLMVTTHGVSWLQGGKLVGMTIARYATAGPDSVLIARIEGTRK
jgi:hypothetical protein